MRLNIGVQVMGHLQRFQFKIAIKKLTFVGASEENKTKYFRLRLDEVSSERPKIDLRLT